MAHLLIVDDEQSICWALSKLAEELGLSALRRQRPNKAWIRREPRPRMLSSWTSACPAWTA